MVLSTTWWFLKLQDGSWIYCMVLGFTRWFLHLLLSDKDKDGQTQTPVSMVFLNMSKIHKQKTYIISDWRKVCYSLNSYKAAFTSFLVRCFFPVRYTMGPSSSKYASTDVFSFQTPEMTILSLGQRHIKHSPIDFHYKYLKIENQSHVP